MYLNFTAATPDDIKTKSSAQGRTQITSNFSTVEDLFISSSFLFHVALDAEFIGSIERNHERLISCPTGSVTAQTVHPEILVSLVYNLFPDGMS